MKTSEIVLKTQKENPREANVPSHKFLVRASFIHQTGSGFFSLMPLGFLVFKKIEKIIREELNKAGCQEILMPIVQPARLWKESGRYEQVGDELLRVRGRDEDYVVAMTHEETVTDIVRRLAVSYEDLPFILNQIQSKFRDEPRPRGGLLRLKEFVMQDAYSFDKDENGLDQSYQKIVGAYEKIFKKLDLPVLKIEASSGIMGGKKSEEFVILSDSGEDKIVLCQKCGYKANIECASSLSQKPEKISKSNKEEVKTPKLTTVSQVADCLKITPSGIIKSMVYKEKEEGKLLLVLIRGDLEINEEKLQSALRKLVTPASAADCQQEDIPIGFVGPVGLKNIPVYADFSIKINGSFVVGANKPDTHLVGITLKDFKIDKWLDIAEVKDNDICQKCGGRLSVKKVIELGHAFKLGTKYSEDMKACFTDRDMKRKPILMGCYGIGLERAMAAVVENHLDENGIIWPKDIAPFQIYLMDIVATSKDKKLVEVLYNKLVSAGIEVLYDDRDKTAGFKFAEADLIGCPLRLTISRRSLGKSCIEIKERSKEKVELIKLDKAVEKIKELLVL